MLLKTQRLHKQTKLCMLGKQARVESAASELGASKHQSIPESISASSNLSRAETETSLVIQAQRQPLETDYFLTTLDCLSVETQESLELRRCVSWLHVPPSPLPLLPSVPHVSGSRLVFLEFSFPEDKGQTRGQTTAVCEDGGRPSSHSQIGRCHGNMVIYAASDFVVCQRLFHTG